MTEYAQTEELETQTAQTSAADPAPTHDATPPEPVDLREQIVAAMNESRARDEKGRFAKAEETAGQDARAGEGKADAAQTQTAPAADAEKAPDAAQQAQTASKAQPPISWSAEAKAEFHKLPPRVQDAIAKRELEVHQGLTRQDEFRTLGRQIQDVAQPYAAMLQSEGANPVQAFNTLLNSAYILRYGSPDQKLELVNDLIQRYNVPLGVSQDSPQPAPQPQGEVQALHQRLTAIEAQRRAEEEAYQRQQAEGLRKIIDDFAATRPHYSAVSSHMAALLNSGLAADLQDAYDQACWAHPNIRSTLEAEKIAAAEESRRKDLERQAAAARHAGSSVTGAPRSAIAPGAQSERSLRDELRANFRTAQGRV